MELDQNLPIEDEAVKAATASTESEQEPQAVTESTPEVEAPADDTPEEAAPAEESDLPEAQEPQAEAAADEAEAAQGEDTAEAAPEAEAAEAAPEGEEAAEGAPEGETLVATPDVAPAISKIEVARINKETLIERARELAESTDWRKAGDEQRKLMDEWRQAGFAGKDDNNRLWEEFRAARDIFYKRRDEHYAELRAAQGEVVEVKRAIIEEARAATENIQNWVRTSNTLNELMDRWKAAGNAGRENEQALWEEFNGIRRDFRNRRKADLAERRAKERSAAEAKRAIVDEARAISESGNYVRENSDRMRALSEEYKAAGYAGKPANDDLWNEFRAAQNAYWQANSAARDAQRRERSERLQEAVERKSGQIEHLKDQNETLTTRLESTLDPEKVAQIKRWIAENEERLGGLKDDIDEIKKKI